MEALGIQNILIYCTEPELDPILSSILSEDQMNGYKFLYANSPQIASAFIHSGQLSAILFCIHLSDEQAISSFSVFEKKVPELPVIGLTTKYESVVCTKLLFKGVFTILQMDQLTPILVDETIRTAIQKRKTDIDTDLIRERYLLLSKATNDMVYDRHLLTDTVYRNAEQFIKLTGFTEYFVQQSTDFWISRIHPDDYYSVLEMLDGFLKDLNIQTFDLNYRFLNAQNEYRFFYDRGFITRDEKGNALRIIGAINDVSELKLKEIELKKLSMIAQETINGAVITDAKGRVEWVNKSFTRISGYTLEEVKGKSPGSVLQGKETDPEVIQRTKEKIKRNEAFTEIVLNYNKGGRKYWNHIQVQPIFDEKGKLINYFGLQNDITETKRLEQELIDSETKYRKLFDLNPLGILIWNPVDFTILEVNARACAVIGYSREKILQLSLNENAEKGLKFKRRKIKGYTPGLKSKNDFVWEYISVGGKPVQLQISSFNITYGSKKAVISIGNDVTEEIKLWEKLQVFKQHEERKLIRASIEAQEREMEFLRRELHDNVIQILASSRLILGLLNLKEKNNLNNAGKVDSYLGNAIREIRSLSHSLVPPLLSEDGLIDSIEVLARTTEMNGEVKVKLTHHSFNEQQFNAEFKLSLYRIVQEQLSNILKYAKASLVEILLQNKGGQVLFEIKDNGIGFDQKISKKGIGLVNMRTRSKLFDGVFKLETSPGKGVKLRISYPLSSRLLNE